MLTNVLLFALQIADPLAVVDDAIRPDHDILSYAIGITIPETGTEIQGAVTIAYRVVDGEGPLVLDFDSVYTVDSVVAGGTHLPAPRVRDGRLSIPHWGAPGDSLAVTIFYHGAPRDGLYIQDNVHGARTAFADNWPNRARHWFPGEDHPGDKAYASFTIDVPSGWRAVANGNLESVDVLAGGRSRWHWRTERKIPVYTMVIGAGDLTVAPVGSPEGPPQALWSFPQDSAFALETPFARVAEIVRVYEEAVGPFPYAKLAHVESSTRFGGMENSGAIFYTERGYARRSMGEPVVAHETAHQWFGDAVTEYDWHHLWLSEGFATYFTPVFFERMGEQDRFAELMAAAKQRYLASDAVDRPVIDTTITSLFELLNANNYQKGGWILHMLRGEMGDEAFFAGLRDYYHTFRDSTALSRDLLTTMERHSTQPLRWFFEQWLLQPGYPQLDVDTAYDPAARVAVVTLRQVQSEPWGTYRISVPVVFEGEDGSRAEARAEFLGGRTARVVFRDVSQPRRTAIDPRNTLLVEVVSPPDR